MGRVRTGVVSSPRRMTEPGGCPPPGSAPLTIPRLAAPSSVSTNNSMGKMSGAGTCTLRTRGSVNASGPHQQSCHLPPLGASTVGRSVLAPMSRRRSARSVNHHKPSPMRASSFGPTLMNS